jgi:flagellar assembly protein FliH
MAEPNVLTGDFAGTAQVWTAPSMEGHGSVGARRRRTVGDIVAQEEALFAQAKADGHAEGLAQAKAEIDARLRHLDAQSTLFETSLAALARPLALLDTTMQETMAELSVAIARQLLRRELKSDPTQVIAVVRETVALLPAAAREVRVQLHPEDAALLRERLATPQAESAWTILEDPVMSRGGCRVTAEAAQIDARLETRLAAVMTAMLGETRAAARADAASGDPA